MPEVETPERTRDLAFARALGTKIQELRQAKDLSQVQLAERVGVERLAVLRWENGQAVPKTRLLRPLALALGVSLEELTPPA